LGEIFFFNKLIAAGCCLRVLFLQRRSCVLLLKKTKSKLCPGWIGAGFCLLALLLTAQAALATDCDVHNNPNPFIGHDLTATGNTSVSYCELCGYSYVTFVIANPYEGVDMTDMTVVENLGNSGLTFDPTAPMPVTYRVHNGSLLLGSAPAIGACGSTPTFASAQVWTLSLLETRQGNNQSNTINACGANSIVLSEGSPCLVASDNLVDFVVTSGFAACISHCSWEQHSNTSVYPGGEIWTCG